MKIHKLTYTVFLLLIAFSLHACYEDKSTFADNFIDEVVIDTTGIKADLYVGYQEQLELKPTISIGGNANIDYLKYEWDLARIPGTKEVEYQSVGSGKYLDVVVARSISTKPYLLKLTVTDTKNHNLQYTRLWKVYVQSSFIDGLLIADSKDGATSDFTLIKNKTLTLNYDKDEVVYREILKTANGAPYNGLFSSITYQLYGNPTSSSRVNQVWAITNDGEACRFKCEDFSQNGSLNDESIITYRPDGLKFESFFKSYRLFFASTNQGYYNYMPVAWNNFTWYDPLTTNTRPNNNVITFNSSRNTTNNHTVWLDKNAGKFLSYSGGTSFSASKLDPYQSNSNFDPNQMSAKSAIAAISSEDAKTATFLLKDDITGIYDIYTLNQYVEREGYWNQDGTIFTETSPEIPATAGRKINIPTEGTVLLNKAVSVFFAQNASVLYVATEDGVYAMTFAIGNIATLATEAKYTPTAGEKITIAKIYQQGHFVNDIASVASPSPEIPLIAWNNKAVIVATKTATEGKVYVIPLTQIGTGTMDPSRMLSYGGFGDILDITAIGY